MRKQLGQLSQKVLLDHVDIAVVDAAAVAGAVSAVAVVVSSVRSVADVAYFENCPFSVVFEQFLAVCQVPSVSFSFPLSQLQQSFLQWVIPPMWFHHQTSYEDLN